MRPRTLHRRPLGPVQQPELDACRVGGSPHDAVQRVDLADQMALPEPTDGWIARHLADGRETMGDECRSRSHSRRHSCRFGSGVAAAHHDDVVSCRDRLIHVKQLMGWLKF